MTEFIMPQYLESIQKGDTVMYGNKPYRVQDDGRGFLHIVIFEEGKRRKLPIGKADVWFEFGSEPDWRPGRWEYLISALPYLLKQGFDIFGLIEAGLAIDITKLNK